MSRNPFTISFGKKPMQYISRLSQTNEILDNFRAEDSSNQIYVISGIRGIGKTVMMTNIAHILEEDPDWVVAELNPMRDILQSLVAKLYALPNMHTCFLKAKLDFSAFGLGASVESATPVTDIEQALELMLAQLKKEKKRLLITIDEVTNSEYIRTFTSSFQILLRRDYPIYLLMTGLYENIHNLQNEKTLTFLYRAPKIMLEPLNYTAIRKCYMDIFCLKVEEAEQMATLTKGYSFAFQVLGYLYWNHRDTKTIEDILAEYDQYLEEYVYSKIWSELSALDQKILIEMALSGETKVKDIREASGMKSEVFSVYRDRLKRRGIVDANCYGYLSFVLPRFEDFVKIHHI